MTSNTPRALVGASDIARIAGINRATVSNWRRRDVGFPQPVAGNDARPLFDLDQVIDWLAARDIFVSFESQISDDSLDSSESRGRRSGWDERDGRGRGRGERHGHDKGREHGGRGEGRSRAFDREDGRGRGGRGGRGFARPDFGGRQFGGREFAGREGGGAERELIFRAEAQLRGTLDPYQARRLLIELLAYVALDRRGELAGTQGEPISSRALTTSQQLTHTNPALAGTFAELADTVTKPGVSGVADHLVENFANVKDLSKLSRKIGRRLGGDRFGAPQHSSTPALAKLYAGLTKGVDGDEPWAVLGAGTGQVLARLARSGHRVVGFDNAPDAVDIAAAIIAIEGNNAQVFERDVLVDPPTGESFGVVVSDTPFGVRTPSNLNPEFARLSGKPARTSETYFVELTQKLLSHNGRGIIHLPRGAWDTLPQRDQLFSDGRVEAVIELPEHSLASFEGVSVVVVLRGSVGESTDDSTGDSISDSTDAQTLYVKVPHADHFAQREGTGVRGRGRGFGGPGFGGPGSDERGRGRAFGGREFGGPDFGGREFGGPSFGGSDFGGRDGRAPWGRGERDVERPAGPRRMRGLDRGAAKAAAELVVAFRQTSTFSAPTEHPLGITTWVATGPDGEYQGGNTATEARTVLAPQAASAIAELTTALNVLGLSNESSAVDQLERTRELFNRLAEPGDEQATVQTLADLGVQVGKLSESEPAQAGDLALIPGFRGGRGNGRSHGGGHGDGGGRGHEHGRGGNGGRGEGRGGRGGKRLQFELLTRESADELNSQIDVGGRPAIVVRTSGVESLDSTFVLAVLNSESTQSTLASKFSRMRGTFGGPGSPEGQRGADRMQRGEHGPGGRGGRGRVIVEAISQVEIPSLSTQEQRSTSAVLAQLAELQQAAANAEALASAAASLVARTITSK